MKGGEVVSDVLEKVSKIIVDRLGVDESEVTLEASFKDDLGADSLDLVEIVMAIEEEYNIQIDDGAVEDLKTVGDILAYISKK